MNTPTKKSQDKDVAPTLREEAKFPEVHPDLHSKSGMQELPTAPGFQAPESVEPGGGGAGSLQHKVAPNPSIGTTHDEDDNSKSVAQVDDDAEQVYSYEQALSLPVVDKGTPVKAPSEAQQKALMKKQGTPNAKPRPPVLSFKDKDRRTMQVVKTKDGLGAMPVDKEAPAPNAAA